MGVIANSDYVQKNRKKKKMEVESLWLLEWLEEYGIPKMSTFENPGFLGSLAVWGGLYEIYTFIIIHATT